MGFINENISDEDMKKYDMEEKYYFFYPEDRKSGPSSAYKFNWTIDRERKLFIPRKTRG